MKLKRVQTKHITACVLVNKFPTDFASNLYTRWTIFQGDATGRGVGAAVRDIILFRTDTSGMPFDVSPSIQTSFLQTDCWITQAKPEFCAEMLRLTGCKVWRRGNAPSVHKEKWQKRKQVRQSCWLLTTSVSEWKQGQQREMWGKGWNRERDRQDWIEVSAIVKWKWAFPCHIIKQPRDTKVIQWNFLCSEMSGYEFLFFASVGPHLLHTSEKCFSFLASRAAWHLYKWG